MNTALQRKITITLDADVVGQVDRYIDAENERKAPSKLSLTALINAALPFYIANAGKGDEDTARAA